MQSRVCAISFYFQIHSFFPIREIPFRHHPLRIELPVFLSRGNRAQIFVFVFY